MKKKRKKSEFRAVKFQIPKDQYEKLMEIRRQLGLESLADLLRADICALLYFYGKIEDEDLEIRCLPTKLVASIPPSLRDDLLTELVEAQTVLHHLLRRETAEATA